MPYIPADDELRVMTGVPIDINAILALDIAAGKLPPWEPGEGYALDRCTEPSCRTQMWLGPRQLIALDLDPTGYLKLCMSCSAKVLQATEGGGTVHDLGGR